MSLLSQSRGSRRPSGNQSSSKDLLKRAACEALERRLVFSANLTAAVALPVPPAILPEHKTRVAVTVSNLGDAPAGASSVSLYASADLTFDPGVDPLIATVPVKGTIQPGRPKNVRMTVAPPAGIIDGEYYLVAQADSGNAVVESDETDNANVDTRFVQIQQPFVDLAGTLPAFAGVPVTIGVKNKPIKGAISVRNDGNVTAKGPFAVGLYLSSDTLLDGSDRALTALPAKNISLKPGAAKALKAKITLPTDLAGGAYYLLVNLDTGLAFNERHEDNNLVVSPNAITIINTSHPAGAVAGVTLSGGGAIVDDQLTTVDFGTVDQGATGPTRTFTVSNTGGQTLTLGPVSVPAGFVLDETLSPSISPGASDTFTLHLDSATAGNFGGNVSFATNDAARNPFDFPISGVVSAPLTPTLASALGADAEKLVINSPEQVGFNATVQGTNNSVVVSVFELDSVGADLGKVVDLFDDGDSLHGDGTAGDGIFSNTAAIQFAAVGDRFFVARMNASGTSQQATATAKISGVEDVTDEQFSRVVNDNTAVEQSLRDAIAGGQSVADALAAARDDLLAHPEIAQADTIELTERSIGWRSPEGIFCIASTIDDTSERSAVSSDDPATQTPAVSAATADCGCGDTVATPAAAEGDPVTQNCKRALILSPFAWQFEPAGGDEGDELANILANKNWTTTLHRNALATDTEVTIDDFRNLSQYSLVSIATHGENYSSVGVAISTGVNATLTSKLANFGDYNSDRLVLMNGKFAITRRFVSRYSGSLDDTIVIASACKSSNDHTLADAYLGKGAGAFIGFSDYVDSSFAAPHVIAAVQKLLDDGMVGEIPGINVDRETDADPARFDGFAFAELDAKLKTKCDLLKDNDLFIQYSWPQTVKDLDTATGLLGVEVGYSTGGISSYLNWSGDNTATGGVETVLVDLEKAFTDGAIASGPLSITCKAGWYIPSNGSGPALLTVALKNKTTGVTSGAFQLTISPGSQTAQAETLVATITVGISNDADPMLSFTVS